MLAMLDARSEDQAGIALGSVLHDFSTSGLHQCILIHQACHFIGDKFPAAYVQFGGIRFGAPRLGHERTEVAIVDQFANTNLVANLIEESVRRANRAGLQPVRRCRKSNHPQQRIHLLGVRQKLPVHSIAF